MGKLWRESVMAAVSASSMLEFVRRIFNERRDYGVLTIRQLRNMYTKEIKIKHLSSENREVFASIVTTVVKEFENVEATDNEELLNGSDSNGADKQNEMGHTPPHNGNCSPANSADSPVKRNNQRRSRPLTPSSSEEDDDDVIRAVKETLGVPVRRKPTKALLVATTTTATPEPQKEATQPTEPTSDSDSEGRLMIAESPAASPKQPSDSEGIEGASNGTKEEEEEEGGEKKTKEKPSQLPKHAAIEDTSKKEGVSCIKKEKSVFTTASPESPSPPQESNSKNHKSVDDMPLFTLKLTKTKSGSWVMVRPKSEESGGESPPQKRRRIRKLKKKTSIDDIFSSSDDEPLSQIRNRAQIQKAEENAPSLSDLEDKLSGNNKRKRPKARKPQAKKEKQKAVPKTTDEDPTVAQLKKCVNAAGLRVKYVQLFADAEGDAEKASRLRKVLADAGLTGKPTLKNCRKLKEQREQDRELQSLDKANIVETAGRPRRSARTTEKSAEESSSAVPKDVTEEASSNVFSRLKDIIDSEGSD
ncbi:HIRA-interacting protein 3-like [Ornithodoros turicata]